MQNILKFASRRRRLTTSAVAVFAAVGAAALTAVSIPADAASHSDFRVPVFRSPAQVRSIFVSTTGYTIWRVGDERGEVGTPEVPAGLDICYTYLSANNGDPVRANRMYAYISQAPGRQDPNGPPETTQGSNPTLLGGAAMSIITFTSPDCTDGLVKEFKGLTVPHSGDTFDLDLN